LIPSGSVRITVAIGDCSTWAGIEELEVDAVVEASDTLANGKGGSNSEHGHPAKWIASETSKEGEEGEEEEEEEDLRGSVSFGSRLRGSVEIMRKTGGVGGIINRWKNRLNGKRMDEDEDEEDGVRRSAKILVAPPHLATKAASFSSAPTNHGEASAMSASAPVEFLQAHAAAHMAAIRVAAENSADVIAIPLSFVTEVSHDLMDRLEELALVHDTQDEVNAMSGGQEASLDDALDDQLKRQEHRARLVEQAKAKMSKEVLLENAVRAMRRVVYDINMPKRITQEVDAKKREVRLLLYFEYCLFPVWKK
jgi:hypothetical protein